MARIFLIITIFAGIFIGVFGYLNSTKYHGKVADLQTSDTSLKQTSKKLDDTKKNLAEVTSKLDDTTKTLTDTNHKAESMAADLSKAQSKATDLEKKIADTEQKVSAAQAEAQDLKSKLGAQADATKAAEDKAKKLDDDKRLLVDDLASKKAEIDRLNTLKANSLKGVMPPGINAKVVSVNKNWNFVVLNVGESQQVVPNGEFTIYRNKDYLAKVRVASTDANACVADILPDSVKGEIQVGDEAMNN